MTVGAFSDWLENDIIDHYLRTGTVYISVHTADPADDVEAGEVSTSGTGYVRKAITFGAGVNGVTTNTNLVTYDTSLTDWGTITHFAIWDAASSGHMLWHGALATPKPMTAGDTFKFNIGQVTCSAD